MKKNTLYFDADLVLKISFGPPTTDFLSSQKARKFQISNSTNNILVRNFFVPHLVIKYFFVPPVVCLLSTLVSSAPQAAKLFGLQALWSSQNVFGPPTAGSMVVDFKDRDSHPPLIDNLASSKLK